MTESELKEVKLAWAKGEVVQFKSWHTVNGKNVYQWVDWKDADNIQTTLTSDWRIKPKTKLVRFGEIELPEPVREPLKMEQHYWFVELDEGQTCHRRWQGGAVDIRYMNLGLVHLNSGAARQWLDFFLSLTAGEK